MYTYMGCFRDSATRLFPVGPYTPRNNIMSTNICFNYCNSKNYDYFATEYEHECFCGNGGKLGSDNYPLKMETDCNKKCKGHETQTCGGTWRASVYKINKNGQTVLTTTHTPTSQKQRTSDIGHQLSTTKHTQTSPEQIGISIYTIIIVPVLVLVLIAAVVVTLVVYYRRKRGNDLVPCEIQQYQTITERIASHSYTAIRYNQKTDINIAKMNNSRHSNNTTQCKPQTISASNQQRENNCNNYESLSINRKSVEHIYQSESIHNNQFSLGEHTYESTEEALQASIEPDVVQYQSLTNPLQSDTHVYASTSLYK